MKALSLKIIRFCFRVVTSIMPWLPSRLEREMAYVQGKGFGEESAYYEAKISMKLLSKFNLERPIILDIGANIGDYSDAILSFKKNVQIYAFEPATKAREILEARFAGKTQVSIVPLAIGNKKTQSILYSNSPASGMASLTRINLDHKKIDFNNTEKVDVETLDRWVKKTGVTPDFIKIDVEGHEYDVFVGGNETLKITKLIQFEFGNSNIDTRIFFRDLHKFLIEESFIIFRIAPIGLLPVKSYQESDEYFKPTNYLAIKKNYDS